MRIQAKCSADIVGFSIKRNQTHDGKEGFVDIEVGVDRQDASDQFGHDFDALAFATMMMVNDNEGAGEKIVFLQDTIKPGSRVMFDRHIIEIDGHEIRDIPVLTGIKTIDGAERVIAKIRIPVEVTKKGLVSALTQSVGKVVTAEFNPEQLTIPGTDADA